MCLLFQAQLTLRHFNICQICFHSLFYCLLLKHNTVKYKNTLYTLCFINMLESCLCQGVKVKTKICFIIFYLCLWQFMKEKKYWNFGLYMFGKLWEKKSCILGLTRSLQSTPFQNTGGWVGGLSVTQ